jgi:hypothetical protein
MAGVGSQQAEAQKQQQQQQRLQTSPSSASRWMPLAAALVARQPMR